MVNLHHTTCLHGLVLFSEGCDGNSSFCIQHISLDLRYKVLKRIQIKLCDLPKLSLSEVNVGVRPVPLDGLPVIGEVPNVMGVFAAIMHSGVTLGPLVG